ncbi:MAG TPA: S8 family serine peptidase, partial [Terriglobia bacterium]|nr:S8 family serine peptidase [Terriglobia bacterium]
IAADVPVEALDEIRSLVGPASLSKDINVPAPGSIGSNGSRSINGSQVGPVVTAKSKSNRTISPTDVQQIATSHPDAYLLNNAGTRIEKLHAKGFTGEGVIVAVIDSGFRPGFTYLDGDQSLIGGMDFVGDGLGFSNVANDGHGTFAAGLISGNGSFVPGDPLQQALSSYAPGALDPATGELTLLGTAPSAKIYAVRVFGADASVGAPLSVILEAIQHVIDLRRDYDKSHGSRGLKIDVCNLSLGVTTLNAGRDMLDRSVDALLKAGIVPVVSAGNTGPASLTISSPGSSMSSLTVGGITRAANDRILAELIFGPGTGGLYHPNSGTQTSWFSSRGPNADGRLDPDVVVSAQGNFAQGYCPDQILDACDGDLSVASGTSFSAPIVSGIAAVLRQAFPDASATEIRNSIIQSARKDQIDDGSLDIDRGNGVPDAYGAYKLITKGKAEDFLPKPPLPDDEVSRNVERNADLTVFSGNVRLSTGNLKPGQRFDVLYEVEPDTVSVVVSINNVDFSLPLDQQNQFFGGDDLFVNIHSAKTSSIGANGDYAVGFYTDQSPFVFDDAEFTVNASDTGIMRITLVGDFINAGKVSADVNIHSVHGTLPRITASGTIHDQKLKTIPIRIPAGVQKADFLLEWEDDWGHYPTSDIDMTILDPNGNVFVNESGAQPGATLASPERAAVENPTPGNWQVIINGFNIPARTDKFQLRVTLDGTNLSH